MARRIFQWFVSAAVVILFVAASQTPALADPIPLDGCWTVGTTEPDGVYRYVRVCYPPER